MFFCVLLFSVLRFKPDDEEALDIMRQIRQSLKEIEVTDAKQTVCSLH